LTTFNTPGGKMSWTIGQYQKRQRRLLGRLDHYCVAGSQRRREFPRGH
jgi:hypothetical protein